MATLWHRLSPEALAHKDHADDPDRRMTQDLDTPEVRGARGAAMAAPCPQQEGGDEDC